MVLLAVTYQEEVGARSPAHMEGRIDYRKAQCGERRGGMRGDPNTPMHTDSVYGNK